MNYNTKHKSKKIYGGVLQNPNDPRNNFFNFLKNSSVTLLSNSSNYGIIFKVDIINPSYKSPYTIFRTKHFGEQIKCLIVKVCPLVKEYKKQRPILLISGKEKKTTPIDDFLKEYYAQIFIALDTCKYLETICPFPVYSDFFKKTSIHEDIYFKDIPKMDEVDINETGSPTDYMFDDKECLDIFKQKFNSVENKDIKETDEDDDEYLDDYNLQQDYDYFGGTKTLIEQLINNLDQKYDYLGIMAMEIADGYNTLKTFKINPENYKTYENMARHEIISMALEQRLLHGDFHNENILINPNYEGYFYERLGKSLLIDFGIVKYLTDKDHDELKELISQNKYLDAINKIYYLSIDEPLWEYPGYTWFKNVEPDDITELILLEQQRQQSKQQLEAFSKNIRQIDPTSQYPIIPLNLRIYQQYLPKMSFGLFFKGGFNLTGGFNDIFFNTTDEQSVFILLQNILKTISFGINSFLNISQKIEDIKKQPKQKSRALDIPNMVNIQPNYKDVSVGVGGKLKPYTNRHKKNNKKNKKNNTRKRSYRKK